MAGEGFWRSLFGGRKDSPTDTRRPASAATGAQKDNPAPRPVHPPTDVAAPSARASPPQEFVIFEATTPARLKLAPHAPPEAKASVLPIREPSASTAAQPLAPVPTPSSPAPAAEVQLPLWVGEPAAKAALAARTPKEVPHRAFWDAYWKHETDVAAARSIATDALRFSAWRVMSGLPSRNPNVGARSVPRVHDEAKFAEAYLSTDTDSAACKLLGIAPQLFSGWRALRGLPPKHKELLERQKATKRVTIEAFGHAGGADTRTEPVGVSTPLDGGLPAHGPVDPPVERSLEIPPSPIQERPPTSLEVVEREAQPAIPSEADEEVPAWRRAAFESLSVEPEGPPTPVAIAETDAERMAAYHRHNCDADAAHELGISDVAFASWRRRNGLEAKAGESQLARHAVAVNDPAFDRAYWATESDYEAAKMLGTSYSRFVAWREKAKLPCRGTRPEPIDHDVRHRIYRETRSDEEAAVRLGISRESFARWRQSQGLEPKRAMAGSLPARDDKGRIILRDARAVEWMRMYATGLGDKEIAARVGCLPAKVTRWRQGLALPPNNGAIKFRGHVVDARTGRVYDPSQG